MVARLLCFRLLLLTGSKRRRLACVAAEEHPTAIAC